MGIFYLFYMLLIKRQRDFVFNRYYLLITSMLATIIPLISLPAFINSEALPFYHLASVRLHEITVHAQAKESLLPVSWILNTLPWIIYFSGIILLGFRFIFSLAKIFRLTRESETTALEKATIVFVPETMPVFSFFHFIFIPKTIYQSAQAKAMLDHERIHIRQKHSIDLMLLETLKVFQWFNPFLYLIRKEVKENQEFLADAGVEFSGQNIQFYQHMLFQQATGIRINPVVNHFSYSLLKKRMMMMKNQRPKNKSWTKFGWTILALVLTLAACKQSNNQQSQAPDQPQKVTQTQPPPAEDNTVYKVTARKPMYKGGNTALIQYLSSQIKYPETAKKEKIEGRVFVNFVVEKDGSISHVKVLRGIGHGCDKEAVRVIKGMLKCIPGENSNGQAVRVSFNLPIRFKLN